MIYPIHYHVPIFTDCVGGDGFLVSHCLRWDAMGPRWPQAFLRPSWWLERNNSVGSLPTKPRRQDARREAIEAAVFCCQGASQWRFKLNLYEFVDCLRLQPAEHRINILNNKCPLGSHDLPVGSQHLQCTEVVGSLKAFNIYILWYYYICIHNWPQSWWFFDGSTW